MQEDASLKYFIGLPSRREEKVPKRTYSRQCSQYSRYTLTGIDPKNIYIYVYVYMYMPYVLGAGIAQAERLRNRFSISSRAVNFSLVRDVHNSSGSQPSPIQFVPTIFFPETQRQGGVDRTAPFHLVPKLKISSVKAVIFLLASWIIRF